MLYILYTYIYIYYILYILYTYIYIYIIYIYIYIFARKLLDIARHIPANYFFGDDLCWMGMDQTWVFPTIPWFRCCPLWCSKFRWIAMDSPHNQRSNVYITWHLIIIMNRSSTIASSRIFLWGCLLS